MNINSIFKRKHKYLVTFYKPSRVRKYICTRTIGSALQFALKKSFKYNDGQMNPMFMMAMMDKGGNNSMIETMLMMQMMGNNQMSFPFMPNQSQKEEK